MSFLETKSSFVKPAVWIIAFQLIAMLIGVVTRDGMGWYDMLAKSSLNPPDIVFPIVWTILYIMLALAGWQAWENRKLDQGTPFRLFWMQMFLNWGWSFIFFGFQLVALGFIWIVALLGVMLAFVFFAWKHQRLAAYLVIPTMLWGCFAAHLNYAIWTLN